MIPPLLTTKFFIPQFRPDLISRPQLVKQIENGLGKKLTLVSAPAGFGKTTLLSEWVKRKNKSVAWLSLDEEDNNLARFLTYFISAFQTYKQHIGDELLSSLQNLQPPSSESVLVSMINDIADLSNQFIVVLDDYHMINSKEIDEAITFLLEHQPANLHLIISTRVDPFIPLARFRSKGQMNEIRENELRFTSKEASTYLNENMMLNLSDKDISSLVNRTEGWITGLHLAGLSLLEQEDLSAFISKFTGHHRNVADYLIDEVLAHRPAGTKEFLLQTSILERMTSDLCNAVTGLQNGQAMLEQLEKSNIFLIPLDDDRQWYRYHHLFSDLLRYRLRLDHEKNIPELHIKASKWHEENGVLNDAIKHAIEGKDYERAIRIIQSISKGFRMQGEVSNLLFWKDALPLSEISKSAEVCISFAWALLLSGKSDDIDQYLALGEKILDQTPQDPDNHVALDNVHILRIRGEIALIRGEIAYNQNNLSLAEEIAQQALILIPKDEIDLRNYISVLLGWVLLQKNNHLSARKVFEEIFLEVGSDVANQYYLMDMLIGLGKVLIDLGLMNEAEEVCKFVLAAINTSGRERTPIGALAFVSYANMLVERNEMQKAENFLEQAEEIFTQAGNSSGLWKVYRVQYRVLRTKGLFEEALESLDKQEQISKRRNYKWDFGIINAYRADTCLAMGKMKDAIKWAENINNSINDFPPYIQEICFFVLARVHISQGDFEKTERILKDILKSSEVEDRKRTKLRVLIMQSLLFQARGKLEKAQEVFSRAISLAAPENFYRPFISEGEAIRKLLEEASPQNISSGFIATLLSALELKAQLETNAPAPEMVNLLTARELEVLRLVAQGLKYNKIAEQLIVSLNTVRSHSKNIYSKLGVNNRTQAIQKAHDLNIL